MKKAILALILGLTLMACSDDNDCCVVYDISVNINYLNAEGQNLLEIDNGYNESNITIYHKINGEWKQYYNGNLDSPKGIKVIDSPNDKFLSISPSITVNNDNFSETKIQFSASDFDIIKTEINQSNPNKTITKVWYNGILKWKIGDGEKILEIVK